MTCQLCGADRKLIKAHAVPEAFFRVLREGGETPIIVTNTPGKHTKRSPIGIYDRGILCGECEQSFGTVDEYGIDVIVQNLSKRFVPCNHNGEVIAFTADDVDQARLKMFVLSVLWRASVSTQDFYAAVKLGPHRGKLLDVIKRGDSSDIDEYSVTLSKWIVSEEKKDLATGLMSPFLERWDGVNSVRLYLGLVVAYVKVDKRPFPDYLREAALGRLNKTYMIAREFEGSKDLGAMRKVVQYSSGAV